MSLQTKTFSKGGTSDVRNYTIKLKLTEESTSVSANTSLVSYVFSIERQNYGIFTGPYFDWDISISGKTIAIRDFAFNIPTSGASSQVIASGQITVAHDSDGGKTMPFSVYTPDTRNLSPTYGPPEIRLSGSWELTTIPRASSISAINADIGSATLITISRASSAFTHTVTYKFGSLTGTIATKTTKTSIPWTIPTSFYGQITSAKYGTVTLTCQTYSGSTLLGTKTATFRATADEDACRPTVSGSVVTVDALSKTLTGGTEKLIRYVSTARATITATAKNSATISKRTVNGQELTSTKDFPAVETGSFAFAATDSRGYTGSKTVKPEFIQYIPLTLTPTVKRITPTGDTVRISIKGNFWAGNFGAVENALTLSYQYQVAGGAFTEAVPISGAVISGNTYTVTFDVGDIDYREPYIFRFEAKDKAMTLTQDVNLSQGIPVFDWGKEDFRFNVPVEVMGAMKSDWCKVDAKGGWSSLSLQKNGVTMSGLTVNPDTENLHILMYYGDSGYAERYVLNTPDKAISEDIVYYLLSTKNVQDYVIAQGSSGNWRWRKWNSGVAECWQRYSYETPAMVAVGGIFYSPKNVGGLAYPFEFITKPTELVSCDGQVGGWYAAANDLPTNTTTETGYYHFFSGLSRPAAYIAMNIHEIGRWK